MKQLFDPSVSHPAVQACGDVVSTVGVEAFVKHAGEIGFFSTSRQEDPRLIRNRGSYCSCQRLQPGCVPPLCSSLGILECDDVVSPVMRTCWETASPTPWSTYPQ